MWRRRKRDDAIAPEFPAELLAEARSKSGGWVYAIDPGYASDGADGAVPPEGIIGAWKIGDDGRPTGEYRANDRYGGSSSSPGGLARQRRVRMFCCYQVSGLRRAQPAEFEQDSRAIPEPVSGKSPNCSRYKCAKK